jgi:3-hydroxyacyl-CoA dehydrogenase
VALDLARAIGVRSLLEEMEAIAHDLAGDVDLAMVMGTGFPPFRGGLLRFADSLTSTSVAANLKELAETAGPRFDPALLVIELAAGGSTFYEAFRG